MFYKLLITIFSSCFFYSHAVHASIVSIDRHAHTDINWIYVRVSGTTSVDSCVSAYALPSNYFFSMEENSTTHTALSTHADAMRSIDGDEISRLFVLFPYYGIIEALKMLDNDTYTGYADAVLTEYALDGVLDDYGECADLISNAKSSVLEK